MNRRLSMRITKTRRLAFIALTLLASEAGQSIVYADGDQSGSQPEPSVQIQRPKEHRLGVEGFGNAGITWPAAKETFEAARLDSKPFEFGGGGRVVGLWRDLFAQVALARWSDTGERIFVDSTGEVFPLGIPLNVKATYVDVSAGWKTPIRNERGTITAWSYIGGGAGFVNYSETSPFAEPGDDLETRSTSYHVLLGVEVPILDWLAASVDGRYRFVPDVLGEGGASAAFGDDVLGGMQVTAGVRVGFGGSPRHRPPSRRPPAPETAPERLREALNPPAQAPPRGAVIIAQAPVFLRPDRNRTPLRTLAPGTAVTVVDEQGDWIRVQFNDPQYGSRVGYIEKKYVEIR